MQIKRKKSLKLKIDKNKISRLQCERKENKAEKIFENNAEFSQSGKKYKHIVLRNLQSFKPSKDE